MTESSQIHQKASQPLSDRAILIVIMLVALANGLMYLYIMPAWQHYDEPNHFEVVWLMAHLGRPTHPGDYDPEMSRAVVESMVANRFWGDTTSGMPPEGAQVHISGYSQLDEKPGYYLLASLPVQLLHLFGMDEVAAQLRAARFASLLLYLVTILCAWGVTCELTRPGHALRWMTPLSIALLPGFTDLMTAVNNDVGAVAVFSLFLWGSVRLILRRFSILNLVWVLAAVVLAYFTKVTALFMLALLPVVFLFAFFRNRLRWLAWTALGAVALIVLLGSLTWGDASLWARNTFQSADTRLATSQAPLGEHAFQVQLEPDTTAAENYQLHQLIDLPAGVSLDKNEVTVGAWMWASRPVQATSPIFNTYNGLKNAYKLVDLNETPQYIAYTFPVPGNTERNFISLRPLVKQVDEPVTVYFDGIVVLPGSWPLDQPPVFNDINGKSGTWGGKPFENLIRNGSAEASWVRLRPWVDQLGVRILPDKGSNQPSVMLYYLLDTAAAWPFQQISAQVLFRTFWARFGWGHVPLMQSWPYGLILVAMLLGLVGASFAIWHSRRRLNWPVVALLALAFLGVWIMAFMRGANYPTLLRAIYYPTARYAFPVIIPSMLLLNVGWYEVGRAIRNRLRWPAKVFKIGYILTWAVFDLYALLSIAKYYYL